MFHTTFNNECALTHTLKRMGIEYEKNIKEDMARLYQAVNVRFPMYKYKAELGRLLNCSEQTINNWELRGVSKKGLDAAASVIKNLNTNWIISGAGDMFIGHEPIEVNVREGKRSEGLVPKISWVQAGDLCDVDDPLEPGDAKEWLICPVKHGPRTYVLQVDGPSMDSGDSEGYPDGFDIFVDPDVEAGHNDDVVVRTPAGRSTFKRLQISSEGKFLIALNPNWPERIIQVPEGTVICGVVIYSGRPRRRR